MANRLPQLADVQCHRVDWQPGDRIIVRVRSKLDFQQRKRLRSSIQKFARCEVEVLIINELEIMGFEIQKGMAGMPCPVCGRKTP